MKKSLERGMAVDAVSTPQQRQHVQARDVRQAAVRQPTRPPQPPHSPAPAAGERKRNWAMVFYGAVLLALVVGWFLPLDRFFTPERGVGYLLGIIGGAMMLLLLIHSLRKRVRWASFLGSVKGWFRVHMALGVLGPALVLFHADFSLGAANSNVALISMLVVAISGFFGRYTYNRIHFGLYGRAATLEELKALAARMQEQATTSRFLPELLPRLQRAESSILAQQRRGLGLVLRPIAVAIATLCWRLRIRAYVRRAVRRLLLRSPVASRHWRGFERAALTHVDNRLQAARRVAEFESYERLFSLWHVLHIPLFFLMLVAAIVHIIAVHVY